jgi:hypothetical protein
MNVYVAKVNDLRKYKRHISNEIFKNIFVDTKDKPYKLNIDEINIIS